MLFVLEIFILKAISHHCVVNLNKQLCKQYLN